MQLLKPSWIHHDDHPILCIDVHPDDTRFVTGGQGADSVGRIVIWNMKPVLELNAQEDQENHQLSHSHLSEPKLLCQLDHHNACVNSVRWCHSGRYLASGGDDKVIIIWRLTAKANPNSIRNNSQSNCFGKTAYETWKPVSTLRSHAGDILDMSWSPDDKYLASASVDNTILVWDAHKFPVVIAELKGHASLVKGVTWDPVGNYLASQSGDKTLRIWRTSDWAQEHIVTEPFTECGGTTHVLRLDWSPDGMYLVSAHAMNGGGPTAQIVERDGWKTDKDFVGHRKAVTCVRFNPNIMTKSKTKTCLVALGSRDRSISVWSTHLKRPVVVVRDLFDNTVMDLAWSSCGTVLMACSWDGTVAVAKFDSEDIGKPLSYDEKNSLHERVYGKSLTTNVNANNAASEAVSSKIVQNVEVFLARKDTDAVEVKNVCENGTAPRLQPPRLEFDPILMDVDAPVVIRGPIDKQIETRRADGRRRITPMFLPNIGVNFMTDVEGMPPTIFQNSENSNHSNLRENMVSGIEDVKIEQPKEEPMDMSTAPVLQEPTIGATMNIVKTESQPADQTENSGQPEVNSGNGIVSIEIPRGPPTSSSAANSNDGVAVASAAVATKDGGKEKPNFDSTMAKTNGEPEPQPPILKKMSELTPPATTTTSAPTLTPAPGSATLKRRASASDESKPLKPLKKTVKLTTIVEPTPERNQEPQFSSTPRPGLAPTTIATKPNSRPISPLTGTGTGVVSASTSPPKPLALAQAHSLSGVPRRRLSPMKITGIFSAKIVKKPDIHYTLEAENQPPRNYVLRCRHELTSGGNPTTLPGLSWTVQTDAAICGVSGDGFRVIAVCEDATVHILDLKGHYAIPPLMVSSVPSRMAHNGDFFLIVTTKATIHIWNIHTKKSIKTESIMPLITQPTVPCPTGTGSEPLPTPKLVDIANVSVSLAGVPRVVLSTGKCFMFNADMGSWMVMSDPKSHGFAGGSSEDGLGSLTVDPLCRRTGLLSQIKLRLATAKELERTEDVREWLIVLAKAMAAQGLRTELHQLCEDLLGPTHSSVTAQGGSWSPTMVGVDKRKALRLILDALLKDLLWQDLYCEFKDLLDGVEEEINGHDEGEVPVPQGQGQGQSQSQSQDGAGADVDVGEGVEPMVTS